MEYTAEGRSSNALVRVIFIIDFGIPFPNEVFSAVDSSWKKWKSFLPRRSVTNAVLLDPVTDRALPKPDQTIAISYEALHRDGDVQFGLRVEASRIMFIVGDYTGWSKVWPVAREYLSDALSAIPPEHPIISYSTEYTDLFRASGDYLEFDVSKILRPDGRFAPKHIFERKLNWHLHTGFFEEHKEARILTRINADLRDNPDEHSRDLSVVLFHSMQAARAPFEMSIAALPEAVTARGLDNFEELHKLDRDTLADLLTVEMATKIGLLR